MTMFLCTQGTLLTSMGFSIDRNVHLELNAYLFADTRSLVFYVLSRKQPEQKPESVIFV